MFAAQYYIMPEYVCQISTQITLESRALPQGGGKSREGDKLGIGWGFLGTKVRASHFANRAIPGRF